MLKRKRDGTSSLRGKEVRKTEKDREKQTAEKEREEEKLEGDEGGWREWDETRAQEAERKQSEREEDHNCSLSERTS